MGNLMIALSICTIIIGIILIICYASDDRQAQINKYLTEQNEELKKAYLSAKEENYKLKFQMMLIKFKDGENRDA